MLIALFGAVVSSILYVGIDHAWKSYQKDKRKQKRKDKKGDV
jgi:hypothetical protein